MEKSLGLAIAIIAANDDPMKLARAKVMFPSLDAEPISAWAPLAAPFGARKSQLPIIPEVGSEVIVGFLMNDMNTPVVLGQIVNEIDG